MMMVVGASGRHLVVPLASFPWSVNRLGAVLYLSNFDGKIYNPGPRLNAHIITISDTDFFPSGNT
jgi:hypothetical protein